MKNIRKILMFSLVILFLTVTSSFAYNIDFKDKDIDDVSNDKANAESKVPAVEMIIKSVPEPLIFLLLGAGLICLVKIRRKLDK